MTDQFNPFVKKTGLGNIKDAPQQASRPSQGPAAAPIKLSPQLLLIGAGAILVVVLFIMSANMQKKPSNANAGEKADARVTLMKNQSVLFLSHYLNLNYTVFKEERTKAEAFMTPELLSEYKESFYENAYVNKILSSQFVTSYVLNEIIPTVYTDDEGIQYPAIKVIGVTKYSSMLKYTDFEMPFTIILAFVKDAEGNYKKITYAKFM